MSLQQQIRRIGARMAASVLRAIVNAAAGGGGFPKLHIVTIGGRNIPDVEYLQPQGLYFLPVAGAEGIGVSPTGQTSATAVVCASSRSGSPSESLAAGEGGLHYQGTFKVFLSSDGKLSLGAKVPDDFVALASLVDDRLSAIQTAYDAHTHVTSCPAGGGSAAVTPSLIGPLAGVASTTVKCQS